MSNIVQAYHNRIVEGWAGEKLAKEAWNMLKGSSSFKDMKHLLVGRPVGEKRKMFLYQVVRKVLGKDTLNYPQEIGDCVSFGAKNASEYLECCEIFMKGDLEKFRNVFPPYFYGTGRVFIGNGSLGNSDGSLGSWQAEAVIKYGVLASDETGVPKYAGSVAKKWGYNPGPPKEFVELAKIHPIKSAAKINSWDELVAAICNGYVCTVASDQGFTMEPRSDGFHAGSGSWAHQMCIMGVDETYTEDYALILNSWGDVHGHLKDFQTNEDLPVGVIRARRKVIENMIRAGECFAYSQFEGFPEQPIDKKLFKMI